MLLDKQLTFLATGHQNSLEQDQVEAGYRWDTQALDQSQVFIGCFHQSDVEADSESWPDLGYQWNSHLLMTATDDCNLVISLAL